MEWEGSRRLLGRTDACQCILVLKVIPLDIVGYCLFYLYHLVIVMIVIVVIIVSVLFSFPRPEVSLRLPLLVLLRLPQPLTLGTIRCPHG